MGGSLYNISTQCFEIAVNLMKFCLNTCKYYNTLNCSVSWCSRNWIVCYRGIWLSPGSLRGWSGVERSPISNGLSHPL